MRILLTVIAMGISLAAAAEERGLPVSLESLQQISAIANGDIVEDGVLAIAASDVDATQLLFELNAPGIAATGYALKGEIAYTGVGGQGYLQLDNHFGEQGTFFTKTLASDGELRSISGDAEWRGFTLPFSAGDGSTVLEPERLTLSVHLPDGGTVRLRNMSLFQYAAGESPFSGEPNADYVAGMIGGIAGTVVGLWGALVGVLAGRGRARGFVLNSATILLALGVVAFIGGLIGMALQPGSPVYYAMILTGVIVSVVTGLLRRILPKRYEEVEVRRMQALDA